MSIREMKTEDKNTVFDMMRKFYDSPAVFHTSSDAVLIKDIEDCIGDMPLVKGYVFEEDGETAGYAMISFSYTTEYGGMCVWIEDLYIKPEYRNRKLSSLFFRFLEEQYPDAVRFKLEVEQENETAIAAYKKRGYTISPYFEMTKEMTQG